MVGIPGQRWESVADDIERFRSLELDMIGLGPYIAHPSTPLAALSQVPCDEATTLRVLALARLACPGANIPATTALDTIDETAGLERGLLAGANVIMPNLTPTQYAALYQPYPRKSAYGRTAVERVEEIRERIQAVGRTVGTGRGDAATRRSNATAETSP